jgi:hypothetical protein
MSLLSLLNLGSAMPKVKEMGRYNLAKPHVLPEFGSPKKTGGAGPRNSDAQPVAAADQPVAASLPAWKKALPRLGRSNPFVPRADTGTVAAGQSSAQPELCLDKVKVVRNDLSDADVVVVPKVPPGSTVPSRRYVRPEAHPDQLGKKAWHLLGARLFGAAATKH